jgi:transposase-like protein
MQYSREEKAMWVEDWQHSEKSAWAYAKENGLNPQTFVRWTKTEPEAKMSFVEVPAPVITPLRQAAEILIERGDVKIHIPIELGRNELRAVMEGLGCVL